MKFVSRIWARTMVYHSGQRVPGLLRDPQDYLKNTKGDLYSMENSGKLVQNLKQYLSKYSVNNVPDKVLLQVLTHKSFAHGKVPYNEKLSVLGSHLVKQVAGIFFTEKSSKLFTENETKVFAKEASTLQRPDAFVNGLNFEIMGTRVARSTLFKTVVADYARLHIKGIEKDIFWKPRNPFITSAAESGENTVLFDVMNSLVGAINLTCGTQVATKFIQEALFLGENSLVELAKKHTAGELKSRE